MNEHDKHIETLIAIRHLEMFEGMWCYLIDDNEVAMANPIHKTISLEILNKMKELKAHLK